jgi:hypothetical protein
LIQTAISPGQRSDSPAWCELLEISHSDSLQGAAPATIPLCELIQKAIRLVIAGHASLNSIRERNRCIAPCV